MRQPSDKAMDLLKGIERLSLVPYDDQTGDQIDEWCPGATIGYGHLIRQGEWSQWGREITEEEAEELFLLDAEPMIYAVDISIQKDMEQCQFDACVILAFNIGAHGFATSSVAKILNGEHTHYQSLDEAWLAWNKSQGQVNEGLNNRRLCELRIFHDGIYERW
jgi:GH24 family phage-related lysozyme (muramidase)